MVRTCLLLLVALLAWAADPVISDLAVDGETHSSARVTFTASPAVNRHLAWDTKAYWDANHAYRYSTMRWDDYRTAQKVVIGGLTPATTYYACPLVCDASKNCIACDAWETDPQIEFTTSAEPSPHPATPALPDLDAFKVTINGQPIAAATLNVQSDCSDLETQISAAASATYDDQTVHVVIPAGTTCSFAATTLNLPAKSGDGWIIIRSDGTLPTFGTRLDPTTHSAQLATISHTTASSGYSAFYAVGAHHYWFSGIEFTHPAFAETDDVNGTEDGYGSVHFEGNGVHDFVFDRCWFHHLGYPDRARIGVYLSGDAYNVAFLDGVHEGADIWRAYQYGIGVTHTTTSLNEYTGGDVYFGNATAEVDAFTIQLGGSGSGHFRLYAERDGDVHFVHDIETLDVTCTGCTDTYNASPTVPDDAFSLISPDGSWAEGTITNATFLTAGAATTGDPWGVQDGSDAGVSWEGAFDLYFNGAHDVIVHNNYLGATGISVYSEGGYDFYTAEFTRNTFQSDPDLFVATPGDSNRIGYRRQHFELKAGHTVLVEGNQFLDAWVGVTGVSSPAVYLANSEGTTMHDITIKNNLIVKHPSCFQLFGTGVSVPHNPLLYNLLVENNVCEADAYARRLFPFTVAYDGAMRGMQMELIAGGEDWTIRHNTFYGGLGGQPSMLRLADNFFEGLTVQDNIFFLQQSELGAAWGKGLHSRTMYAVSGSGVPDLGPTRYGQAALDAIAVRVPSTQSWLFDHNIIVTGCTSAAACESDEEDLLTVATEEAAYPSGNFWPTGSTYGARIAAVGWTSPGAAEESDYSLTAESAYAGLGTSASDPGVDWDALQAAVTGEEEPEPDPETSIPGVTGYLSISGYVIIQ